METNELKQTTPQAPINGIIEPDYLQYLKETFKRWQQLKEEEITLGTREIAKLTQTLEGAKLNCRYGFSYEIQRSAPEDDTQLIQLKIYQAINPYTGEMKSTALFTFEAEIWR